MRVTSQIWVHAFLRRVNARGGFAVVARKGASEAGAIFIKIEDMRGACDLYGPAPQTDYGNDADERRFTVVFDHSPADALEVDERLRRESGFDPDLWVIAVEDRDRRHFLDDLLVPRQSIIRPE